MSREPIREDVRCRACGALLATVEGGIATLRRGDFVAYVSGHSRIDLHCYRRFCGKNTTLNLTSAHGRQPEVATERPDGAGSHGDSLV